MELRPPLTALPKFPKKPESRFLGMRVMGDVGMGEGSGAVTRAHGDTGTGHALGPCLLVGIQPFPDPAAPRDNLGSRDGRALSMQPPRIPGFPWLHLPELSQGSTGSA